MYIYDLQTGGAQRIIFFWQHIQASVLGSATCSKNIDGWANQMALPEKRKEIFLVHLLTSMNISSPSSRLSYETTSQHFWIVSNLMILDALLSFLWEIWALTYLPFNKLAVQQILGFRVQGLGPRELGPRLPTSTSFSFSLVKFCKPFASKNKKGIFLIKQANAPLQGSTPVFLLLANFRQVST